jgi:hypothetical protein
MVQPRRDESEARPGSSRGTSSRSKESDKLAGSKPGGQGLAKDSTEGGSSKQSQGRGERKSQDDRAVKRKQQDPGKAPVVEFLKFKDVAAASSAMASQEEGFQIDRSDGQREYHGAYQADKPRGMEQNQHRGNAGAGDPPMHKNHQHVNDDDDYDDRDRDSDRTRAHAQADENVASHTQRHEKNQGGSSATRGDQEHQSAGVLSEQEAMQQPQHVIKKEATLATSPDAGSQLSEKRTKNQAETHASIVPARMTRNDEGVMFSEDALKNARKNGGKIRILIAEEPPEKHEGNDKGWLSLSLDQWRDVVNGNATLGVDVGSVEAIYASYVLQVSVHT